MRTRTNVAILLTVVVLTAGCQRTARQPGPTAGPMDAQVVEVIAKEFAFEPTEMRVKPGMVTFKVKNEGTVEHEFMIEGVTAHGDHASGTFGPGVMHEVEVELNPGTYPVSCNVAGHREAGMMGSIIVE